MITKLRLRNFKNFADADLTVGPFTVIVGANASGKSNIRDLFRFLHGIGRRYTIAEIIGGRYGAGGQSEWVPMRGAASEIVRFQKESFHVDVSFTVVGQGGRGRIGRYHIEVSKTERGHGAFRVASESLTVSGDIIYTSLPGPGDPIEPQDDEAYLAVRLAKTESQRKFGSKFQARSDQPVLSQIIESKHATRPHKHSAQELLDVFAGIRFLDLVPEFMRKPAFPGQTVLGDSGENLATVLQAICANAERKSILMDWIRELTPLDVTDFAFPHDPTTGLVQLALKERNGNSVSAYSASDGTLRFLAMLAALLGNSPARLYFFEEIDSGIHPSRLKLLLDLIERQTEKGVTQVVTTTHSPDLLSMVNDRTFKSTSVVFRPPHSDGAIITRVFDLPQAAELRASQGLGRLHASGWMEDVLTLADQDESNAAE
jgi:predicted ATPase